LPAGDATITGTATGGTGLRLTPRLVLQDGTGLRTPCDSAAVPLDGRPHRLTSCGPASRIVALDLRIDLEPGAPGGDGTSRVTVDLAGPGSAAGAWSATAATPDWVTSAGAEVRAAGGRTVVRTTATVDLTALGFVPAEVVATAFPRTAAVPVAVSSRFADALGAGPGDRLAVTVGTTPVPVVVATVVPAVPSAPGQVAMLADVDALSRALIGAGELAPAVDAWWVGGPARSDGIPGLGTVLTRAGVADDLAHGPLRAGLPAALVVLVPAAVVLALAGTVLHVSSDLESRALEVARLRALGVRRRGVVGGLLAQHGGVLVLLLGAGAVVGALAARVVGPLLIRSDVGAAPVPAARTRWPWPAEGVLLLVLLAGCTLAVALVVLVQVRRANASHLRVGP
jgi:hypothetical protein